jgi:hypothetical protein
MIFFIFVLELFFFSCESSSKKTEELKKEPQITKLTKIKGRIQNHVVADFEIFFSLISVSNCSVKEMKNSLLFATDLIFYSKRLVRRDMLTKEKAQEKNQEREKEQDRRTCDEFQHKQTENVQRLS